MVIYSGLLVLVSRQKGGLNRNTAYSILHQTSLSTPQGPWKHFLSNCPGDGETKKLATQKDVFRSHSTKYVEVRANKIVFAILGLGFPCKNHVTN